MRIYNLKNKIWASLKKIKRSGHNWPHEFSRDDVM